MSFFYTFFRLVCRRLLVFLNAALFYVLIGVIVLLTGTLVYMAWTKRAARLRMSRVEQQSVQETLQEALDSRTVFNIRFEVDSMRERFLRGPCVAVGKDNMLIDVNLTYGVPAWEGQPVQVYFGISGAGKGNSFYEFNTTIARTVPYLGNVGIELRQPARLIANQRRTFVRFSPPHRFVGNIRLWTGRPTQYSEALIPSAVAPPVLSGDALAIDNISAGGLRLIFPTQAYDGVPVERSQLVLLNLLLRNADGQEALNLWCMGTVMQDQSDGPRTLLSLKFERWAPEGDADNPLSWFPVGREGGVPPLAAWVMRRQLEVECRAGA